jgi:hypothetical protein
MKIVHVLKSIGSVIAGFLAVAVLSMGTDILVQIYVVFPRAGRIDSNTPSMLAVALAYRSAYTFLGGYLTARLAPSNPVRHIVALMILGGIGGVSGIIAGWSLGNHWYPILLAVTGPVLVWLGGVWCIRRRE